ncbi:glycosyl hydrolase family 95 catalytic domain-containing protein [Streptomyces sp. NPDC085540]|uniref:glycosyl hydrolase family 95 catalytic domain-containing protein n=1 Tax=Streptomyces sp. NPDC085540 TaxID=3365730 RepID=UPI0037CF7286
MNAGFGRRTFLRTSAGTGLAAAGAFWVAATPQEALAAEPGPGPDLHERALLDARMEWPTAPRDRQAAPFLGDGSLTAQVYVREDGKALRFSLGRAGRDWDAAATHLDLVPSGGAITGMRCELSLWNAELTGSLTTSAGSLTFSALVPRGRGALLVSVTAEGGERETSFTPAADTTGREGERVAHVERRNGTRTRVAALISSVPPKAEDRVASVLGADAGSVTDEHRAWWHAFYRRSHLSVPDRTLQRFHWAQLYTAASVLDAHEPPAHSAPTFLNRANHTETGGVATALGKGGWSPEQAVPTMAFPGTGSKSGPVENRLAAWGAPALWDAYRHTGDERILRELLHPLLRRAVDYYSGFLTTSRDGTLHLPVTHSPGYADVVDCTYDLSLLRWATTHLIDSTRHLGLTEPRLARWQEMASKLAPYEKDDAGVRVGAGVRLTRSHAGAWHLLWLHPLYEKSWSRKEDRELMRRSFEHWAQMREEWDGRSYAIGASLAAAVRKPEPAVEFLHRLLGGKSDAAVALLANTRHRQNASAGPAVAPGPPAPFAAAQAVLDLLVSGDPHTLSVFPAVPKEWRDASVSGLRAPGAYVVDAARADGRTAWIRVHSTQARTLTLEHGIKDNAEFHVEKGGRSRRADVKVSGDGVCAVRLAAGEVLTVSRRGGPKPGADEGHEVAANESGRRWGGSEPKV